MTFDRTRRMTIENQISITVAETYGRELKGSGLGSGLNSYIVATHPVSAEDIKIHTGRLIRFPGKEKFDKNWNYLFDKYDDAKLLTLILKTALMGLENHHVVFDPVPYLIQIEEREYQTQEAK